MPAKPTRRSVLAATGAAIALFHAVPRHCLGGAKFVAPSEKLNIAGIGIGGMGAGNLANLRSENIVALCDVDFEYAVKTAKQYPNARTHKDYRVMLEQQKDIDAVVIATPDHTHALIAAAAMRAGKHVYCQKPLAHNVYESRVLGKIAKETGVATQLGIQGHSTESVRQICEWIWDGAIGEVAEVDAFCSLTYYPWGHAYWSSKLGRKPAETPPVPPTLDWDIWLGPAPVRPYHPTYHPGTWRSWWDFGSGMMGDRGAHTLDPVFWALKLGMPTSVEASSIDLNNDTHPIAAIVTYQFPARGTLPPVKLTWYDGLRCPRPSELEDGRLVGDKEGGAVFKGTKGKIMGGTYGNGARLIPETKMKEYKRPAPTLPRVKDTHEMDWVRACKGGPAAGANFEYGAAFNEVCCLGNVAKRVDGRIEYDAANMKITNNADANKWLTREYRAGWTL